MASRVVVLRLGDITRFLDGERFSLSRRQCEQQAGEFPYYGPQGIIARINSFAYEGEYLLFADAPPRNLPSVPVFVASGRFSASTRVHILACVEEVEPRFLCRCLNALPRAALFRPPWPESIKDIEIALLPPDDQRQILTALSGIEKKTALLREQNRVLNGMAQSLFDQYFIFGDRTPRPLGDFVMFRSAAQDRTPGQDRAAPLATVSPLRASESFPPEGTVFHNLFLYPREDLSPMFTRLLVKSPEFLIHAENCLEHRGGRRQLNAERLMTFEINGPLAHSRSLGPFPAGAYPEFNAFALNAENKIAANDAELKILAGIEQSLFFNT
jgi:hypothetical protein